MNEERATVETPTAPAKPNVPADIREIGVARFSQAMDSATKHIRDAAIMLDALREHQQRVNRTVNDIQRWRKECERKLKNVPAAMQEPMTAMFKAAEDELDETLREIAEEMTLIDLGAEPPEEAPL